MGPGRPPSPRTRPARSRRRRRFHARVTRAGLPRARPRLRALAQATRQTRGPVGGTQGVKAGAVAAVAADPPPSSRKAAPRRRRRSGRRALAQGVPRRRLVVLMVMPWRSAATSPSGRVTARAAGPIWAEGRAGVGDRREPAGHGDRWTWRDRGSRPSFWEQDRAPRPQRGPRASAPGQATASERSVGLARSAGSPAGQGGGQSRRRAWSRRPAPQARPSPASPARRRASPRRGPPRCRPGAALGPRR